jgi:hypothetical protein
VTPLRQASALSTPSRCWGYSLSRATASATKPKCKTCGGSVASFTSGRRAKRCNRPTTTWRFDRRAQHRFADRTVPCSTRAAGQVEGKDVPRPDTTRTASRADPVIRRTEAKRTRRFALTGSSTVPSLARRQKKLFELQSHFNFGCIHKNAGSVQARFATATSDIFTLSKNTLPRDAFTSRLATSIAACNSSPKTSAPSAVARVIEHQVRYAS